MEKRYFIYKITNLVNGKIYIGKTSSNPPIKRWNIHLSTAKKGPDKPGQKKRFQYVHRAIRKHGRENFTFEVIAEYNTEKEMTDAEIKFIADFKSRNRNIGYNLTDGGDGACGFKPTKAQRKRMSLAKMGVFDGEKNPFYGKKHTKETKIIIAEKASKRYKGKNNPFFGKTHSKETLAKIYKTKLEKGNLGKKRKLTDDQINAIREKYLTGNYSHSQLSKEYNLSEPAIGKLLRFEGPYASDKKPTNYILPDKTLKRIPLFVANEIRTKYATGKYLQRELSKEYNISQRTINAIINYRSTYQYDNSNKQKPKPKKKRPWRALSDEQVIEIRKQYGNKTLLELSKEFNVSDSTIKNVIHHKKTYKD